MTDSAAKAVWLYAEVDDSAERVEDSPELLALSLEMFAARGVERASLTDIARGAGISLGGIQRRFGGKDGLFRWTVREAARQQVARACAPLPPGTPADQLRNFCGRGWEILHTPSHDALYRLWVSEVPRYPDLMGFFAESVQGTVMDLLAGIIERGVAEGQFRAVSPRGTARALLASLVTQAYCCNHADVFGPAPSGCHRVVADTLSILLGGLMPAVPAATN